ncbi:MAG: ABC transporter permease [Paracoccus sp. (in: a-proteobacteria)]|nr:ABC transporter permease [Paracoccus sp. (in: a-proteobacteria)]
MSRNGPVAVVFHALFIIFMIAPLAVVVWVSFTPLGYIQAPTTEWSLRWYREIWSSGGFVRSFWLSIGLAFAAATLSLAVAVPAALAIARYDFFGRGILTGIFLSPLMIPSVVLGIAFLRFLTAVSITGTFYGMVLCHAVFVMPFVLRLALASIIGMDRQAERAAISLGASNATTFRRVTFPMILPGLVGGWVLAFITSFDELTVSIFIASPSLMTLPVRLFNHITQTTTPIVASVSAVIIFLSMAVILILERVYGLDRLLMGSKR